MTILVGFKSLFGHKCVDSIKQRYLYDSPQGNKPGQWNKGNLMGSGIGWAAYLPDDRRCNRDNIEARIKAKEFDLVFYHTRTARSKQPHLDLVSSVYKKSSILFFDGGDTPLTTGPQQVKLADAEYYADRGQLFVRELQDGCPDDPTARPGANYRDGAGGGWVYSRRHGVEMARDVQGLPKYYAPAKEAWPKGP